MKKIVLLIIMMFAIAINGFSQILRIERDFANKAIYAELGGGGVIMSFNFDTRFTNSNLGWGGRIGLGFGISDFVTYERYESESYYDYGYYYSESSVTHSYYSIPVEISYILGRHNSRHTFEIGGGITALTRKVSLYNYDSEQAGYILGHLSFMYRIAPPKGGFSFRIGLTPIIGTGGDLFPMAAVSFGYAF
jgi:hypothetical protein